LVAEIDQLKEKTKVIEQTIASLHEQIMNAGGNELRQQKTCVNNIRKKIDSLNTQITKNMVAKSKAEKDVIRLEASIRKIEKEAEQFETKLKELKEEADELSQQMHSVTEDVNRTKKVRAIALQKKGQLTLFLYFLSLWKRKRQKWKMSEDN
jgi:structural maintenance of chromosome 4